MSDPANQHFAGVFFALSLTFAYFWLRERDDPHNGRLLAFCIGATATLCVLLLVAG